MGGLPTAAVTGVSGFTLGAAALAEDSKNPIKLTLHDLAGQLITIRLVGEAWKNAGLWEGARFEGLAPSVGTKIGTRLEWKEPTLVGRGGPGVGHQYPAALGRR
jgi:hypothetical protein